MTTAIAYGTLKPQEPLQAMTIPRREVTPKDVRVKIIYSGICHSDKHHIFNDWGDSKYLLVPGHEISGEVEEIGNKVTKFKIGDKVAIGNMTDSCQQCANCHKSWEQYCLNGGPTWVYNSNERLTPKGGRSLKPEESNDPTFGGYSTSIVAQEDFVLPLPENLQGPGGASLLCAGITMYDPLKLAKMGKGHKIGIAGIGGLGHLGLKMAHAMGAEVVGITTSAEKVPLIPTLVPIDDNTIPIKACLVTDPKHREMYKDYFDMIISTIPVAHDVTPYLEMLKPGQSRLHIVGNMNEYPNLKGMKFVFYGKNITSSNVGGLCDTKEMLQFCSNHNILADVVVINPKDVNVAITNMVNATIIDPTDNSTKFRYVMDMTSQ